MGLLGSKHIIRSIIRMTISMNLFMAHLLNALFMGELGNNHIQVDFLPQTESLCRHPYFWRYLADLQTDMLDRISPDWALFRMSLTLFEDLAIWIS